METILSNDSHVLKQPMVTFRKATLHDVHVLDKLVNSAYRGEYSKQGWTTEADLLDGQRTDPDKISEMISDPGAQIELACDGQGRILGCVYLKQETDSLYLGMLTVEPTLQSQGTGKVLLKRSEEIAKNLRLNFLRMTVISSRSELISYYERRGYRLTGKTEPFPETDPRFGLPKSKLMFVEMKKAL